MKNMIVILVGLMCLSFGGHWYGYVYYGPEDTPAGYALQNIIMTNGSGSYDDYYDYNPGTSYYASYTLSGKWWEYGHVYDFNHTHWYSPLYSHFFTDDWYQQNIHCTNHQPPPLPPSTQSGPQTIHTQNLESTQLTVYPTLVSTAVTLNATVNSGILNICDESGKTIESHKVFSSLRVTIPVIRLSPGVYFTVLKETDGKESVKKFVVVK